MRRISILAVALTFNAAGTQVATVKDDVVAVRRVHISRDLGTTLELDRGLGDGETVVLNPSADLASGQRIKIQSEPTT